MMIFINCYFIILKIFTLDQCHYFEVIKINKIVKIFKISNNKNHHQPELDLHAFCVYWAFYY